MRQYLDAKQQHRDAILFFRMGDFYEMFYEDALVAARALELTLTSRSKDANGGGIPMCGVPFHAVDGYIARLVKKGFRVAICEQVEDPRKAKGIVKREVVRVVSPGTLTDVNYLDAREPAFLMAVAPGHQAHRIGVALLDLSTGEFAAAEYAGPDGLQALADELAVLQPREIIVPSGDNGAPAAAIPPVAASGLPTTPIDGWTFELERRARDAARSAARRRARRVRPRRPPGGCRGGGRARPLSPRDAEGRSRARALDRVSPARRRAARSTRPRSKHLEIVEGSEGGRAGSLLDELDRTVTSMGSRLLRVVAAASAGRARADSRSARRGRGAGLPHHRARQVPRRAQGGPGSRAAGRARRARHRRTARPRRR